MTALDDRNNDFSHLQSVGIKPYPDKYSVTIGNINELSKDLGQSVSVAGRVIAFRVFGKLIFLQLYDITGELQVMISLDNIGAESYSTCKKVLRCGDFIGVQGETFKTSKGEFTIRAASVSILSLSLRPLPEKWHGLKDIELRSRQRYLDAIANERSREVLLSRTKLISSFRHYFEDNGFYEIETPILNNTQSGALAKPFITSHNALKQDMFLRIAPETYLKRANAAGFNRVFEFAKCFRNEGISSEHLQEFTMLEYYGSYWNFKDSMLFTKGMLQYAIQETFNTLDFRYSSTSGEVIELTFGGEWPVLNFRDLLASYAKIDILEYNDFEKLSASIVKRGIALPEECYIGKNFGTLVDALYKETVRPHLIKPCFLTGHPIEISPLARSNDNNPKIVDRYHIVVGKMEIVNAYSELVDPVEQRKRLIQQSTFKDFGDSEAMDLDEDFLLCMEHGMPPISGAGLGIARLLKLILGLSNIKEAVFFPLLRGSGNVENV